MELFKTSSYSGTGHPRPDDLIDPNLKNSDPEYSLNFSKFIYSYYCNGYGAVTASDVEQFRENRAYAMGMQDSNKYKNLIVGSEDEDGPPTGFVDSDGRAFKTLSGVEGWVNIDWESIFSPLPKLVNTVVGMLSDNEYEIQVNCSDETSTDLRTTLKYKLYASGKYKEFIAAQQAIMGISPEDEQVDIIPSDIQELNMFEQIGMFKLQYETAMERVIGVVDEESDAIEIDRLLKEDLVINGICAAESYLDPVTKKVYSKYLDPARLILQQGDRSDFSDAEFFGYIDLVPLTRVIQEAGIKDKDRIQNLAQQYGGRFGNPANDKAGLHFTEKDVSEYMLPVLRTKWITIDSHYKTKRINKEGEVINYKESWRKSRSGKIIPPKMHDKPNRSTNKVDLRVLYQSSWVIDTDIVYDYGRSPINPFDFEGRGAMLPIHVFKTGKKSIIRSCIPIEDQIQLTYVRLQDNIAKAPPPGLAVSLDSIEDITIAGSRLHPRDTLKIRTLTGNFFYRMDSASSVVPGGPQGNKMLPFTELKGGVGTAINEAVQAMEFFYRQLAEIAGVDRISSVSVTPSTKQGKAVTEMAIGATTNSISNLSYGVLKTKKRIAKCTVLMADGLKRMFTIIDNPYTEKIGYALMASIYSMPNNPPVRYGFSAALKPSDEMKAEVRAAAQAALAGGKNGIPALKWSEYLFVISMLDKPGGINYSRVYIAYKESMADQLAQARAQQTQQMQAEMNQQQEQLKLQNEVIKIQEEHKAKMAQLEREEQKEINVARAREEEVRKTKQMELQQEPNFTNKELQV